MKGSKESNQIDGYKFQIFLPYVFTVLIGMARISRLHVPTVVHISIYQSISYNQLC
jgi:hypothetical protein